MKKILYALILIALYVILIATCPAQTQHKTDKIRKHPGCNAWYWVDPKTETPEQRSAQAEATNKNPCGCLINGMQLGVKDAKECAKIKKDCAKDGCTFWGNNR